jgi:ubiquinone/menaquinone biosynthesis C-methylase UbiE
MAFDTTPATDLVALKLKQQATWSAGDYAVIGTRLQIVGEMLAEALDLHAGQKVLDVAAGNGNATLACARRNCEVVSTDYVGALLKRGQARAEADGLSVQFREADAENLPFADGSFDAVVSTFGVMFTPDQERAARELARVCRPGGKIGLANWTPTGFIGELFKVIGKHLPPPAGVKPPSLWGTEDRLHQLLEGRIASFEALRKHYVFRYRSADDWIDTFRTYYGPMHKAFGALDGDRQAALTEDLRGLVARFNRAEEAMVVPGEYLEAVIRVR